MTVRISRSTISETLRFRDLHPFDPAHPDGAVDPITADYGIEVAFVPYDDTLDDDLQPAPADGAYLPASWVPGSYDPDRHTVDAFADITPAALFDGPGWWVAWARPTGALTRPAHPVDRVVVTP